jgi:hypothetical protein
MLKSWGNKGSVLAASGALVGFNRTTCCLVVLIRGRPVYIRLMLYLLLVVEEECDGLLVVEAPAAMCVEALEFRFGELDSDVAGAVLLTMGVGC